MNQQGERPKPRAKKIIPLNHLSRLYKTDAVHWMAMVRALEAGRRPMLAYYAPLFSACCAEIRQKGSGTAIMDLMHRGFAPNPTSKSVIDKSVKDLAWFSGEWRSEFPKLLREIPEPTRNYRHVHFEGHLLRGGFHALAVDKAGNDVLIYYHPSDWKSVVVKAHIELLTIVAEQRHGMPRESVRFLDFNARAILKPAGKYVSVRRELRRMCELYERVFV